jgi:chemotaxis protein methyltransferase CheR
MNDLDFKFYEELLKRESGLIVTPEKTYLLESRLLPVASKFNLQGLEGIARKLRESKDAVLLQAVVEAMTTNETSFFRDNTPFQRMKEDVLPFFLKARSATKSLRIWSAACSSGQEPYSLAMLLKEYGPALAGWKIEIVATDLSHDILAQAKSGAYSQFEVQRGLPIQMLVKYFTQQGDKWLAKPELKEMITFKPANLLTGLSSLGSFDIVFCRNVLIYFDVPTKGKVLHDIKGVLKQDGVLFLGGAETVMGVTEDFKAIPDIRGVYVRSDTAFSAPKKETPSVAGSAAGSLAGATKSAVT